ncbi:MAG: xanthine dehydrogenase family protein molybdopterin-binding subunit [Thermodesulfobacteriota bacterium]
MSNSDGIYYTEGLPVPETPEQGQEPDFWEKTDVVGKRLTRVDAYERVSGTAVYPADMKLPNMIYAAVVRCPHPSARVKSVDTSKAEKMPGVRAVLTGDSKEAKGVKWGYQGTQTRLFDPEIRFEGDTVAAVAADSWYQANDAARAVEVDYEVLSFTADVKKALDDSAHKVHKDGNLVDKSTSERGDISRGFDQADVVLEQEYETACEVHTPMELHGCVANWEGDRLTIWESSQGVYAIQSEIADVLGIPLSKIRVSGNYMGGGFGSKLAPGKYTAIAVLLARKTGRPVKMLLTREETFLCVGNRPASTMKIKAGVKKDGTLTALDFECTGASGAYPAGGSALIDWLIRDLYTCDNVRTAANDVYINSGPARPFRAPGHPQGSWALEQMMDSLAEKIDMDPVELRLKNIPAVSQGREGSPEYTTTGLKQCIEKGAEAFDWTGSLDRVRRHNRENKVIKKGIGMGACVWFVGGGGPPSTVVVKIYKDGSVNLNMGASDIGTGTKTVMAQVAAEELGIEPETIQIEHADTATTRYATPSGGSKTVPTEAPTVRNAAIDLKRKLLEMAAGDLDAKPEDLQYLGKSIALKQDSQKSIKIKEISKLKKQGEVSGTGYRGPNPENKSVNPFAAQFCEVEVNTKSGEIRVLRFLGTNESGRVMNRLTYDNQVFGGIVMGIGFGLTEFRQLDENQTGKMCNRNWHDYKLPTALDIPVDMSSIPVEIDDPEANNTGAKGLGEPVTIPTAGAIANAIYMATGIRFYKTPVNPIAMCRKFSAQKEG